ncbi:helix-turn-helix transcriptional regulator [Micromonospora sp. NPDC007271]|uniref:helix-turn-helix transcriptional regulator n=1 Tax=Micromonospora sp. NPDC007271 TaxID=3154587 RepID=UPI0033D8324B
MQGRELRGLLHPFLLLLILERPGHGYDLIERLVAMGVSDVEPGHVYRVLRGLERDRSVTSTWETGGAGPARRCYTLTLKGRDDLRSWVAHLTYLNQVIDVCLQRSTNAVERSRGGQRDRYAATHG